MTKSHPMHRKKSINMTFRHSARIRNLYYRVSNILDVIKAQKVKAK